ncbi:MAG: hypothetical protein KA318_00185 [Nitrosomonas sp.]|nr:hypothetical protein [Nitrosomonas sp.]
MTIDQAISHFGSASELCRALGIPLQNYTHWKNRGYIPLVAQYKIEKITNKKLKASEADTKKNINKTNKKKLITKELAEASLSEFVSKLNYLSRKYGIKLRGSDEDIIYLEFIECAPKGDMNNLSYPLVKFDSMDAFGYIDIFQ